MLGLLYFWRLEKEKWFDAIIELIELYEETEEDVPFELFVFGSGSREKKIQELATKHPNIHFFWRQDIPTIKRYVSNCQYALIPSECLESFGLSALNALQRGLTPIGYARGGLKSFIEHDLDLTHQLGHTTGQKLYSLINKLHTIHVEPEQVDEYTKDRRIVRFHVLAGKKAKKILIVSDFTNRIGGIETYINDVKAMLEPHGYQVELFGIKAPRGIFAKLMKYLGIATGILNFWEAIKLHRKVKAMNPDLIRYNSVMRYLGRMPIRATKNTKAKKRMMFHDLGYFAPFPSELKNENQIKTPLTLRHFVDSQPTANPIQNLAIIGKYVSLQLLKKQLKNTVDTFLVPSEFMQDIVHSSYNIKSDKIKVFPHFIQE